VAGVSGHAGWRLRGCLRVFGACAAQGRGGKGFSRLCIAFASSLVGRSWFCSFYADFLMLRVGLSVIWAAVPVRHVLISGFRAKVTCREGLVFGQWIGCVTF
jgi:hypothetical protein